MPPLVYYSLSRFLYLCTKVKTKIQKRNVFIPLFTAFYKNVLRAQAQNHHVDVKIVFVK